MAYDDPYEDPANQPYTGGPGAPPPAAAQCPPGQYFSGPVGKCVPDNYTGPGDGTDWEALKTACGAAGKHWNDATKACMDNPPGEAAQGTGEGGYGADGWPQYFGPTRPTFNFGPVPQFKAPRFNAPTLQDAQNEPGYAFARDEGLGALEHSAAARGLARTGGTYKGLMAWNNKFAEQNYGNVFNRALQAFDRLYAGTRDEYMPLLTEWQTKAAGTQRAGELEFNRWWERYLADIDKYKYGNPSATDLLNAELGSV